MIAGFVVAHLSGCSGADATRPTDQPSADIVTAPAVSKQIAGKPGDVTRFTEETVAAFQEDDFWGSGITTQRDESGRLVYTSSTKVVNDPERTRQELAFYQLQRSGQRNTLITDPVTGFPIATRATRFRSDGRSTTSAVPDQRRVVRPVRPVRDTRRTPSPSRNHSNSRDNRR